MAAENNTPTRRALRMASIGAGAAGSYLSYFLQRAFIGKAEGERKLKTTHTRVARRMRDEMQSLRGPAMKLGQTLSLQAGILPDETLAELASLQMEAPGMHPSLVRVQVKRSLGREPEEIFEKFNPEPFAAASLGQVHEATTREHKRVAVKIQYPGIRETVENDFKWFRTVSKPAQASGHFPKEVIDEMERQMLAETDYRLEADNIDFFSEKLSPLSFVEVPRVFREYSSDKVLTMSRVRGRHLEQFLKQKPSQKMRDQLGTNLVELFYFQLLKLGAFHADPHWGNYFSTTMRVLGSWILDARKNLPLRSSSICTACFCIRATGIHQSSAGSSKHTIARRARNSRRRLIARSSVFRKSFTETSTRLNANVTKFLTSPTRNFSPTTSAKRLNYFAPNTSWPSIFSWRALRWACTIRSTP